MDFETATPKLTKVERRALKQKLADERQQQRVADYQEKQRQLSETPATNYDVLLLADVLGARVKPRRKDG